MTSTARPGRPRDAAIDDAVLAAAGAVLDADGLGAVHLTDLARRTGVSRAAIYRRWPDRTAVVLDVLAARTGAIGAPGTGCTLCDLDEVLQIAGRVYASLGAGVLAQLLAETGSQPSRRDILVATVVDPVRVVVRAVLVEARDRGDLRTDVDIGLAVDTLTALVFHRLLLGRPPLSAADTTAVVTGLLRGIAADPDRLLAEYEQQPTPGPTARPGHPAGHRRRTRSPA